MDKRSELSGEVLAELMKNGEGTGGKGGRDRWISEATGVLQRDVYEKKKGR